MEPHSGIDWVRSEKRHVVRQVADLDGAGVGSVVEHLDPHVQVRPAGDHLQLGFQLADCSSHHQLSS